MSGRASKSTTKFTRTLNVAQMYGTIERVDTENTRRHQKLIRGGLMDQQILDEVLDSLIDRLATIEHDRWSHWQKYMHAKATRNPDGSLVLPADLVSRWEGQIEADYTELSEKEKQSDREQVQRYLPLIRESLAQALLDSVR